MFLIKCVWILTQNNGCESYVVESLVWVKLELKEILFNRFRKKKTWTTQQEKQADCLKPGLFFAKAIE